jgi:hypothetical protein
MRTPQWPIVAALTIDPEIDAMGQNLPRATAQDLGNAIGQRWSWRSTIFSSQAV